MIQRGKEAHYRHQVPAHSAHPQFAPVAAPHLVSLPDLVVRILPRCWPSLVGLDSPRRFQMLVDHRHRQIHAPLLQHPLDSPMSIQPILLLHILDQLFFLGANLVGTLAAATALGFAFLPPLITRPRYSQAAQHLGHRAPLGALPLDQLHPDCFCAVISRPHPLNPSSSLFLTRQ